MRNGWAELCILGHLNNHDAIEMVTECHPPETMGPLIRDIFRAMTECVEREFNDVDLSLSQLLILKLLGVGKITCIGDASRELGIETSTSTRLIDQLENRDLLVRCRSTLDRRVVGISLTSRGRTMIDEMQPRLIKFWKNKIGIFSKKEREQLFDLLFRLHGVLRETGADQDRP